MRRLVYSPRAYVFIKDQSGTIHDVSVDVTAGNVTRKIDQVSSASITLRNPEMKYTVHRVRGKDEIALPVFHPMDPITIYLRRLSGHPVRVFTGFLDRTPYLQLFPGTITLQASCTLKRLLYTYFDPALPYTQSFLREYGWLEMENGVWGSFAALDQYKRPGTPASASSIQGKANGSISELLYATLKHIGHWNHESVYIEKLPDDLYGRLTELAQEFQVDSELSKQAFENLLKKIVGSSSQGGGGATGANAGGNISSSSGVTVKDGPASPEQIRNMNIVLGVAADLNAGPLATKALVEACIAESEWHNSGVVTDGTSKGILQLLSSTASSMHIDPLDIEACVKAFLQKGFTDGVGAIEYARKNGNLPAYAVAQHCQGSGAGRASNGASNYGPWSGEADKIIEAYNSGGSSSGVAPNANKDHGGRRTGADNATTRSTTKGGSNKSNENMTRYEAIVARANTMDGLVKNNGLKYGPARPPSDTTEYDCSSSVASLIYAAGYKVDQSATTATIGQYLLPGKDPTGRVTIWNNDRSKSAGPKVHVFAEIDGKYWSTADGLAGHWVDNYHGPTADFDPFHLPNMDEKANVPTDINVSGSAGASGDAGQSADSGGAAALFGTLNLPGALDTIAANMLSGEKSLMNDKPLMPFIQQLCNAGLRHFQSMPDGKFYAFYPDYFGEFYHHKPYWEIDNIEIINGGIDLDDTALVTHTYVVGDTASPTIGATAPFWLRAVFSAGVVTIYNAFLAGDVLDRSASRSKKPDKPVDAKDPPAGMGIALERAEANSFLERYGARPNVDQDEPLIKSNFYEMFLAYQRFMLGWSRQFLSQFTFTFMPEIYPGGKVGFPEHDLQMYVEEVSHSWDYTSGFLTQASLSAPSVYVNAEGVKSRGLLPPNMVKAIIEPVSQSRARVKDKPVTIPIHTTESTRNVRAVKD